MRVQLPPTFFTDYGLVTIPSAPGGNPSPVPPSASAPQNPSPLSSAHASARQEQPTEAELRQAVADLQKKTQMVAPSLQFSIDSDTGRVVIKVTDANTQEVIRQIPPEVILRLDKELDRLQGLLLNQQA